MMMRGNGMHTLARSPLFDLVLNDDWHAAEKTRPVYEPEYKWTTEKDGTIIGEIELPGVTKEDLELDVKDQKLHLRAVRRRAVEGKTDGDKVVAPEGDGAKQAVASGKAKKRVEDDVVKRYEAEFGLPRTANVEDIKAKCTNGILTVAIPKKPEVEAKRIAVSM